MRDIVRLGLRQITQLLVLCTCTR